MNIFQAIILGIIQGLTEFLPISSSGHVEIGTFMFGITTSENLLFLTVVHGATALSTIVVYRKDLCIIFSDLLQFKRNESLNFTLKILFSTIPVLFLGLFFMEKIESFFGGKILLVGSMLVITSLLLLFANYAKDQKKDISFPKAFIIGIAQAIAVLPGISRSGATISTSLIFGVDKEKATRFSFLMVLIPILGACISDCIHIIKNPAHGSGISITVLLVGFISAFISGVVACTWMIQIVKRGKLIYFAIYCLIVGLIAISYSLVYAG
jgi:undecaprenyl-diphosphatase